MSSLQPPHGSSWQTLWRHEEGVSSVVSWGGESGPEDVMMLKHRGGEERGDID